MRYASLSARHTLVICNRPVCRPVLFSYGNYIRHAVMTYKHNFNSLTAHGWAKIKV